MATRTRKLDKDIRSILEGPQSWKDAAWRLANDLQDQRHIWSKHEKLIRSEMAAEYEALYEDRKELAKQLEKVQEAFNALLDMHNKQMAKGCALFARQQLRIKGLRKALRQMQSHYGYGTLRAQVATLQAEKDALLRSMVEHNNLKAFNAALMNEAVNGK